MFLQGDKPNQTLTRDRASRVLFNNDDSAKENISGGDTFVNFAYNHDVAEFKNLVQSKYPQTFESSEIPSSASYSNNVFNNYHTQASTYETPNHTLQGYYNDANPIPQQYKTFKPKVLTDFEDLEIGPNSRGELDEALLQKIDEVKIYEPKEATTKVAFETGVDRSSETEAYLKLTAKGLIACITFIAVTLLIIILLISNTVSINNSNNKIRRLRDENTQLQKDYDRADYERAQAYQRGTTAADEFAGSSSATPPAYEALPPVSSYPLTPSNPDESTNFFDKICKFFSSLFS